MADMPPGIVDDISSVDEEDPKDKDFRLSKEMLAKKRRARNSSDDDDIVAGTPPTPTGRTPPLSKVRKIITY